LYDQYIKFLSIFIGLESRFLSVLSVFEIKTDKEYIKIEIKGEIITNLWKILPQVLCRELSKLSISAP